MIVFAEWCVHEINKNGDTTDFRYLLRKLNINVEWLESGIAEIGARWGSRGNDFKDKARDYLIGAHAHTPPLIFVTSNTEDFWFLDDRTVTPDECMKRYG